MNKKKILIFVGTFLPGFKAGGPIQSITNFADNFKSEFDIFIYTSDRDHLDCAAYAGIPSNQWIVRNDINIYYSSPHNYFLSLIRSNIFNDSYDLIFINSFFSFKFSFLPLLLILLGKEVQSKILLAPRGEFSIGALNIKKFKKNIYIFVCKLMRLHSNVFWLATSHEELIDVKRVFSISDDRIGVAPNIVLSTNKLDDTSFIPREEDFLRIIFISRISRKKNLLFLLNLLLKIKFDISLSIYGPIEDDAYWSECSILIKAMPINVSVNFYGEIEHSKVSNLFLCHDLFVFPTFGENFGHIIYESLSNGVCVLTSDQTPWKTSSSNSIVTLSLDSPSAWLKHIEDWQRLSISDLLTMRKAALRTGSDFLFNTDSVKLNKDYISKVLNSSD
jgi:glycosyltransferase involved in cell wall biosynthesis